jgi:glycosyltransferase involved in cell wall biosynthesis
MARIFINGTSAKGAGGKSILRNLLGTLGTLEHGHTFIVGVPAGHDYQMFAGERMEIVEIVNTGSLGGLMRLTLLTLPRLLRQYSCDLVFNLADVPIPTRVRQVFLFDWAYAAFPDSPAWRIVGPRERLVRNAKLVLFKSLLGSIDVLVAQNDIIKERLQAIYRLPRVEVVPNAVSLENLAAGEPHDFGLTGGFKMLCLSAYYTHKNIEIFLPVAELIRQRGLDCQIVVTLAAEQHPGAAAFLRGIAERDLADVIRSVGPVPMSQVPSLYQQTDALLLPTLLESFSGTYVEAMFHRKPILTSRLPFAKGVCGDAALYFDPQDPQDIVGQIERIIGDPALRATLADRGTEVLGRLPDWRQATAAFLDIFARTLAPRRDSALRGAPGGMGGR